MTYAPTWLLILITTLSFTFGLFLGHINKGENHGSN